MPCYSPVQAWPGPVSSSGKRPLVFKRPRDFSGKVIPVPCNSCEGCQLERARQWAMRCMDEAQMWPVNSFITLTYDDEHLPIAFGCLRCGRDIPEKSLHVCEWQLFMKKLRRHCSEEIRFFMCGEYGPKLGRPHYHALIFNWEFPDRILQCISPSGEKVFRSELLRKIWGNGFVSVGEVTFGSAAYVARYAVKKVGDVTSSDHFVDPRTGELKPPEFRLMSRRPGIGRSFYEKFKLDMFPSDFRIINGMRSTPARYYGSLYEVDNPAEFARIKKARISRCGRGEFVVNQQNRSVWVPSDDAFRLAVKREVKLAQIKSLSRSLED